jgi:methyltransferase (TIGR00027 family)
MKTHRYSETALLIAKAHVFLSTDSTYKDLVSPEALYWSLSCIESATGERNYDQRCLKTSYRCAINAYERLICRGIIRHYLRRKQHIEQQAHRLLKNDQIRRVVIVAGGFDTLALRLAEQYPGVEFIELDHPATQRVKVQAVGADQPENLQFIPVDFTKQRLEDVLDVDDDSGTLFVVEGVLMYLSEADVGALFWALKQIAPGTRSLIFTYLVAAEKLCCSMNIGLVRGKALS